MRAALIAGVSGVIFAAGLALGGMLDPRKVQGFLDVGGIATGRWDPSLAFVMGGALVVALLTFERVRTRETTWLGAPISLPVRRDIDSRLLLGAALFGVGWGLSGYCPGPAIASLLPGSKDVLWFVAAMAVGMVLARLWMRRSEAVE
ncbi:MAG: YeeE/YedE family protein [Burkholderiales bacterium]|nr:YeeE/YedE family protein [Burkholderiales bacterium]